MAGSIIPVALPRLIEVSDLRFIGPVGSTVSRPSFTRTAARDRKDEDGARPSLRSPNKGNDPVVIVVVVILIVVVMTRARAREIARISLSSRETVLDVASLIFVREYRNALEN